MKATIKDRIVAHRSAPDVYDPPSFEQMADHIEKLEANLAEKIEWVKLLSDDLTASEGREARLKEKLAKLERAAKPFAAIKIKDGMSQPGEIGRTDVTNIRAALVELTGGQKDGDG